MRDADPLCRAEGLHSQEILVGAHTPEIKFRVSFPFGGERAAENSFLSVRNAKRALSIPGARRISPPLLGIPGTPGSDCSCGLVFSPLFLPL
ncbi:hypothetical protein AVEN_18726-1 [Araneus ventricosus]|uniref:Uncharacterized protein n=1 Tax=Araneus ventricosus TaxID=182803 RepID=A0A4Y2GK06_ARAVE|nr:hypothetical protein AVEN_18726-1 [Araneus ventricosus]